MRVMSEPIYVDLHLPAKEVRVGDRLYGFLVEGVKSFVRVGVPTTMLTCRRRAIPFPSEDIILVRRSVSPCPSRYERDEVV